MGRPPAELTEKIQIRLSPEELVRWTACAQADGRSLSGWIRWACATAAAKNSK